MKAKKDYYQLSNEQLLELQKKETEIFSSLISAIKKMGLTYYCIGGTAIGSYKYQGFVPWDDDIDIAMPRKDLMRFIKEGHKFLPNNLIISSCFTEKNNSLGVTKIRDRNTSFFDIETAKFDISHGIFVDIFPIDGYRKQNVLQKFWYKVLEGRIAFVQKTKRSFSCWIKGFACSILCVFKKPNKARISLEKKLSKNNLETSQKIYNRLMVFDKEIFGTPTHGKFNGLDVCLPEKIEEYLTICFGDYRADIAEEKKKGHHYAFFIDVETPYSLFEFKKGMVKRVQ